MKLLNVLASMALGTMILTGCSNGKGAGNDSVQSLTPAEALRNRLAAVEASGKVMMGHHDDPVYGHSWAWDGGRSDMLETAGDYPAVMSWDLGGMEMADSVNLDGVSFSRMRDEVIAQNARGGISTFSWHLRNPVDSADSWQVSDTTIVSRILTVDSIGARFDGMVRNLAQFFKGLTDAEGNRIGVIFRPWHEHTGSWFWWGQTLCSVDDYKALWRRTRDVLEAEGVDNVLYAYSPDRVADAEQYMERYPGDDVIDIMGIDVYHFGGEQGAERYVTDAGRGLGIVRSLAKEHGKIAAFSETGLEGLTVDGWFDGTLLPLLRQNPVAYVVVWRNAHDKPTHFYAPYKGGPNEESIKAFRADTLTLFAKDMMNIK
ncbi:MAG: glycoside hydrolase family 26 protein [Muribaculaceae bacterium]|nr:glycoside hydrolase family 26 protein [Muribaculaceae bacterium]